MRGQGPGNAAGRHLRQTGSRRGNGRRCPIYWSAEDEGCGASEAMTRPRPPAKRKNTPLSGTNTNRATPTASMALDIHFAVSGLQDAGRSTDALESPIPGLRASSVSSGCATRVWSGAAITHELLQCGAPRLSPWSTDADPLIARRRPSVRLRARGGGQTHRGPRSRGTDRGRPATGPWYRQPQGIKLSDHSAAPDPGRAAALAG